MMDNLDYMPRHDCSCVLSERDTKAFERIKACLARLDRWEGKVHFWLFLVLIVGGMVAALFAFESPNGKSIAGMATIAVIVMLYTGIVWPKLQLMVRRTYQEELQYYMPEDDSHFWQQICLWYPAEVKQLRAIFPEDSRFTL